MDCETLAGETAVGDGDTVAIAGEIGEHRLCNIYLRSRHAGERVMASVSRFLTRKLRLKVNEAKSAVARPEARKVLGFSISNDGSERRIAPKALNKFKTRIRGMTRRTRGYRRGT